MFTADASATVSSYSATWPVWAKSDGIVPIMARPFLPNVCVANYDFAKNQQFATHRLAASSDSQDRLQSPRNWSPETESRRPSAGKLGTEWALRR